MHRTNRRAQVRLEASVAEVRETGMYNPWLDQAHGVGSMGNTPPLDGGVPELGEAERSDAAGRSTLDGDGARPGDTA